MNNSLVHIIQKYGHSEQRIKNSKFLAWAYPIESRSHAKEIEMKIRSLHPKASHCCTALTTGYLDRRIEYSSDDGEPSGTAGRPMLNAIKSFELSNTLVAVVRYFGGTKLGASGLIRAYRDSAKLALKDAKIQPKSLKKCLRVPFGYDRMAEFMSHIKRNNLEVIDKSFEASPYLDIAVALGSERVIGIGILAVLLDSYASEISPDQVTKAIAEWDQGYT